MPDFSMDYEMLYEIQRGMHQLADDAKSGGATGTMRDMGEDSYDSNLAVFGNAGLTRAFERFYTVSKTRVDEGTDRLKEFGDTFEGIAHALFTQDAQIAGGAYASVAGGELDAWNAERQAHEDWVEASEAWDEYLEEIGAADYFRENPDADFHEVCSEPDSTRPEWCDTYMDDENAPLPPGDEPKKPSENPPTEMSFEDDNGNKVSVEVFHDDDYNVMREETTITLADGNELSTVREYDDPPNIVDIPDYGEYDIRDYTITSDQPDGSTSVTEVKFNEDGSSTSTTTTTNADGEVEDDPEVTEQGPPERNKGDDD